MELLRQSWPWWVSGPLIGLFVPSLLLAGNKLFGVSASLRDMCAVAIPGRVAYFRYDWRARGGWSLAFSLGILIGGAIAGRYLAGGADAHISQATRDSLAALGVHDLHGLVPRSLLNFAALATVRGFIMIVVAGFLIGFGTAYAGGCTSGHAISGLADFQLPSLVAVMGFFAGGLISTWIILPRLLGG